jgi:hypothetical protein
VPDPAKGPYAPSMSFVRRTRLPSVGHGAPVQGVSHTSMEQETYGALLQATRVLWLWRHLWLQGGQQPLGVELL